MNSWHYAVSVAGEVPVEDRWLVDVECAQILDEVLDLRPLDDPDDGETDS